LLCRRLLGCRLLGCSLLCCSLLCRRLLKGIAALGLIDGTRLYSRRAGTGQHLLSGCHADIWMGRRCAKAGFGCLLGSDSCRRLDGRDRAPKRARSR
jgi:hypothetical protein